MAKKRRSGGRSKNKSGRTGTVQCSKCGAVVPADKAKKYTRTVSPVDPQLARELRKQGAYIRTSRRTEYYCVSCAVHYGKVNIRSEEDRRDIKDRYHRR